MNKFITSIFIIYTMSNTVFAGIPCGTIYAATKKIGDSICALQNIQSTPYSISIDFLDKAIFLKQNDKTCDIDFEGNIKNSELKMDEALLKKELNIIIQSYVSKTDKVAWISIPQKNQISITILNKESTGNLDGIGSTFDYTYINNQWVLDTQTDFDL